MIVLKIHGWHPERGWSEPTRWWIGELARRLVDYTDLRKPECESLASRLLKERQCCFIPLAKAKDRYGATSLRSLLETFGADTTVEVVPA